MPLPLKYGLTCLLCMPLVLLAQVKLNALPEPQSKDTLWTTGFQTLFSSQTIGDKITSRLRSAVSKEKTHFIFSFGISMSRQKTVKAGEETKASLKTQSGKRIQLVMISNLFTDLLNAAEKETIVHFEIAAAELNILKKEKVTGVKIVTDSGTYNYDLHEGAQDILNSQLRAVLSTAN